MRIAVHIQTGHNDVTFPRMLFEVVHTTFQVIDPLIFDFHSTQNVIDDLLINTIAFFSSSTDLQMNSKDDLMSAMSVFTSASFCLGGMLMFDDGR